MITLPAELHPLLIFLITAGLKDLFALFGKEIAGKATAFIAALTAATLTFVNSALAALPADWQTPVAAVLSIAATLVSAFGLHRTLRSLTANRPPVLLPEPARRRS